MSKIIVIPVKVMSLALEMEIDWGLGLEPKKALGLALLSGQLRDRL